MATCTIPTIPDKAVTATQWQAIVEKAPRRASAIMQQGELISPVGSPKVWICDKLAGLDNFVERRLCSAEACRVRVGN